MKKFSLEGGMGWRLIILVTMCLLLVACSTPAAKTGSQDMTKYALQTELVAAKADLARVSNLYAAIMARISILETKIAAVQAPSTGDVSTALNKRVSTLEGKVIMLDSQQQVLYTNTVNAVNTRLAQLPSQYATKGDILVLQARIEALEAKIK